MQMTNYTKRFSKSKFFDDKSKYLLAISLGKRIVHLGCTDWPNQIEQIANENLLHTKLLDVAQATLGIDVDADGINHLKKLYKEEGFVCGDVSTSEQVQQAIIDFKPDIILIPDVLEHIENSRDFLLGVEKVISRTHSIGVFTTPNAFAIKTFIPVFLGIDFTHPDHCSIHNEFTITHAMNDANLEISKIGYLSRDISDRYGILMQGITKPINWFSRVLPRFSDTLYVEVSSKSQS
jgi:hypothetical protein